MNPQTRQKWKRFKRIKRGYFSLMVLSFLFFISLFCELIANNRPIYIRYQGQHFFPTYGNYLPGTTFGLDYQWETHYRDLKQKLEQNGQNDIVLMPLIPYNPLENDLKDTSYPPFPPSFEDKHFLGTDAIGRDVAARLLYGFRIAMFFSILLLIVNYSIGIFIGCLMGYLGGRFDLILQRIIEIWSNIPFLYVVMIFSSIVTPNFWMLISIMAFFGWTSMTWYMRTATYKEKSREYALAAIAMGASRMRSIIHHILPNTLSTIITFIPFSIASGITALTALDFLGFGLPPPTPSWGELLKQGTERLDASWMVWSVVSAMVLVLTMVTFIGEAIREAYDPKQHTVYE